MQANITRVVSDLTSNNMMLKEMNKSVIKLLEVKSSEVDRLNGEVKR